MAVVWISGSLPSNGSVGWASLPLFFFAYVVQIFIDARFFSGFSIQKSVWDAFLLSSTFVSVLLLFIGYVHITSILSRGDLEYILIILSGFSYPALCYLLKEFVFDFVLIQEEATLGLANDCHVEDGLFIGSGKVSRSLANSSTFDISTYSSANNSCCSRSFTGVPKQDRDGANVFFVGIYCDSPYCARRRYL